MYLMYADESGNTGTDYTDKHQPYFVLAGIRVKDCDWHKINNDFEAKKVEICPEFKDNEIHASELFNAPKRSIFSKYSWEDNLKTLEKIVDLIVGYDISIYHIVFDKKGLKKMISSAFSPNIKLDPYLFGYCGIYSLFNRNLQQKNDYGIIFCDELKGISNDIDLIYPKLSNGITNVIEKAFYVDSKKNNFIQMADICALYFNKYFCITHGNIVYNEIKTKHCIDMYNKIKALSKESDEETKKKTSEDILRALK